MGAWGRGARAPQAGPGRQAAAVVLAWAVVGCAMAVGPPPGGGDPAPVKRIAAAVSPEERARAQDLATQALDALVDARRELLHGDPKAGLAQLRTALDRVRAARAMLRPPAILLPSRGGDPVRLEGRRPPVVVPLTALAAPTRKHLRPWRPADATRLRVDLDALERRLARAAVGPPERALGEIFLATGTALSFEGVGPDYAGDDGSPSPPGAAPEAGAALGG